MKDVVSSNCKLAFSNFRLLSLTYLHISDFFKIKVLVISKMLVISKITVYFHMCYIYLNTRPFGVYYHKALLRVVLYFDKSSR